MMGICNNYYDFPNVVTEIKKLLHSKTVCERDVLFLKALRWHENEFCMTQSLETFRKVLFYLGVEELDPCSLVGASQYSMKSRSIGSRL